MGFADGVLSVEVTDSAWLQQMRSLSEKLKAELRSIAGVGVTDILFTLPSTSAERHRAKL
jgi:predicted nucleic acid-binding Zn ribbon protein